MRLHLVIISIALVFAVGSCAESDKSAVSCAKSEKTVVSCTEAEKSVTSPVGLDPETQEVLDKINSAGAYCVPDLQLPPERNYAKTPADMVPYWHVKPYKEHFLIRTDYTGPGRGKAEPEGLESVKIGFIGPIEPTVSVATGGKSHAEALGKKMYQGSLLAIEEANAVGGYHKGGIPFELVVKNDNGLWGASGNEIIDMAYKDKVWAILGTIDGANSHIAIRVALKAEIPMMNTGDTDPTFVETNIPWAFRCISDDRQQGYLLIDYMYRKLKLERVGVIRASNRYGRFGVREILDGSRRLGRPVILEMAYELGLEDFSLQIDRLKRENLDAIVHWGDAADGARILNQMRETGMDQPYFACDRCLSDEFVRIAGDNAEGVVCPYSWNPARKSERLDRFREAFRERFKEEPETFAAHAYDGMNMLIWAVQTAGLNRAKIRDILAFRPHPFEGVTGDITLSAALDDIGDVYLGKFEGGEWKFYSRDELDIPQDYTPPQNRARRTAANIKSR
ncbi:MAG: ABC transporter substrate-binding protein [Planctomycetota bacterium]|jgi:ABC-type branched-subunit amino acid transport system substrate-binding protein